jgi:transposase, IS5 family
MKRKLSPADRVLAQAAVQAVETDPVLSELDAVLDADALYQQLCAKLDRLEEEAVSGEMLLRMLLVKYLYGWNEQQTAEQLEDSLVLRWFCRLGMQSAPSATSVRQGLDQIAVGNLETLANRVEHATERAQQSEGRLRPTYQQRWR